MKRKHVKQKILSTDHEARERDKKQGFFILTQKGLMSGTFTLVFDNTPECKVRVFVNLAFNFASSIDPTIQSAFPDKFLTAVRAIWGDENTPAATFIGVPLPGYQSDSNSPVGACCTSIAVHIIAVQSKDVDASRTVDVDPTVTRSKVLIDVHVPPVNPRPNDPRYSFERTLAHEFGHVLGLPDEYDATLYANDAGSEIKGWLENIAPWHRQDCVTDLQGLMNRGTKLRLRYFDRWARLLMQQEPQCIYSVSSPVNDPNDAGSGCLWDPKGNPKYADNSDMPVSSDLPTDSTLPTDGDTSQRVAAVDPSVDPNADPNAQVDPNAQTDPNAEQTG